MKRRLDHEIYEITKEDQITGANMQVIGILDSNSAVILAIYLLRKMIFHNGHENLDEAIVFYRISQVILLGLYKIILYGFIRPW